METSHVYKSDSETGFVEIRMGNRETDSLVSNSFGLLCQIVDKDKYWEGLMAYTNDFINAEDATILENLDFSQKDLQ